MKLPLKGTVQHDFRPPFFSSFEPAWATDSLWYDTRASQAPRGVSQRPILKMFAQAFKGTVSQKIHVDS